MTNDSTNLETVQQVPSPNPDMKSLEPLIGTWQLSGDTHGTVRYKWMDGGFFLIQHYDFTLYDHKVTGMEIIGHLQPFGETPSVDIKSRAYDSVGNTFDYVYELTGDTLMIWGGEKGSPAYYQGTLSADGNTISGRWVYPGSGGYASTMTRATKPQASLQALQVMVGVWDIRGRDLSTNDEVRGQSTFEWLEGGFFLCHHFYSEYADNKITGVEYIRYDEKSGRLRTQVYTNQDPAPIDYTWEISGNTFQNWMGDVGAAHHYVGEFSPDRNTLIGQWTWPGGGYEAQMTRVQSNK